MSIIRRGVGLGPDLPKIPVDLFIENVLASPVGAAPLIAALCRDLGIPQLIDQEATWDEDRCILSPGERITALIINLLCEERRPLYKVHDNFKKLDTELLFGEGIRSDHLNDDCLGRGLDAFWAINPAHIVRQAAATLRLKERLEVPFVHFDTTTRFLFGGYGFDTPPSEEALEELKKATPAIRERLKMPKTPLPPTPETVSERRPAKPAYGHSKDHRDDLKQITIALAVDRYGIPLLGSVKDGNASDKVSNFETLEEILAFFPPEVRGSMVYIADSALVTEKNLAVLSTEKMPFVSLLPGIFGCGQSVRQKAWEENAWEELGALRDHKDAATYRASEQSAEIGGVRYRLIVIHSSALDKRKSRSVLKAATSEKAALEKAAKDLAKTPFFCELDARKAGEDFCSKHKSLFFPLSFTLETQVVKEPRSGRGRPRKGESIPETLVTVVNVTVGGIDAPALDAELDRRSCFVLITNLPREEFSAREILSEYKGQAVVENIFGAFLKNPVVLDAFFLKSVERLDALGHVLLLAALIYMFLQYKMRESGELFDRPPRGMMPRPTSREALQHLAHIQTVRVDGGPRRIQIPENHKNGFAQILRWTGIDPSIYVIPHVRAARRQIKEDPLRPGRDEGTVDPRRPPPIKSEAPPKKTKEDTTTP